MKNMVGFCLTLLLLAPTAIAAEDAFPYLSSDWARQEVARAVELGVVYDPYRSFWDTGRPITRGDFAANAAALVAKGFGVTMHSYALITRYRGEVEHGSFPYSAVDAAKALGILQGRGDETVNAYDAYSYITRQEAAVMLARTCRIYQGAESGRLEPVTFADRDEIADWALADVALVNQLGLMTGVGEGRFDPLGSYTVEQCILSLLRLYEKVPFDDSGRENPFVIPKLEGGFFHSDYQSEISFAIETEDYYICAMMHPSNGLGGTAYDIYVIDQDLSLRSYPTPIVTSSSSVHGVDYARPVNPSISEDGTKLTYTAALEEDAYHIQGVVEVVEQRLLFQKGVYTVTMDLATGEQTWTHTSESELGRP